MSVVACAPSSSPEDPESESDELTAPQKRPSAAMAATVGSTSCRTADQVLPAEAARENGVENLCENSTVRNIFSQSLWSKDYNL